MKRTWTALLFSCLLAGWAADAPAADAPPFKHREDVIYGRKFGTALTMDVFTPTGKANGAAVVLAVSGGWFSNHEGINNNPFFRSIETALTRRGYTVFAVVHGSNPKFTVAEALEDMNRAVRFIRYHAKDYGIDPQRIGITGGSAGGHLSLMQGLADGKGNPKAPDPVDRESSKVQAVACFFPPTDFLNYGEPGKRIVDFPVMPDVIKPAFDFKEENPKTKGFRPVRDQEKVKALYREASPLTHATADDAPTLIVHGDADRLVPIQQAEVLVAKLKELGVPAELIVKKGKDHGWPGMEKDLPPMIDWFDKYLLKKDKASAPTEK